MIRHKKILYTINWRLQLPSPPPEKGKLLYLIYLSTDFVQIQNISLCNDKTYENLTYDPIGGFSSTLPHPKWENLQMCFHFSSNLHQIGN